MPSNYKFDCYDFNMPPQDRKDFLEDYAEKLDSVIYGDISQMTTNETRTLWRKLYGNSQNSSPLISHLGNVITVLFNEIGSLKNKKKSQLRLRAISLKEKQQQIVAIQENLQEKDKALDRLTTTYEKLQHELASNNINTIELEMMQDDIEQAKQHQKMLLASITVMAEKIKIHNIPLSLDELPHYVAQVRSDDLLINR